MEKMKGAPKEQRNARDAASAVESRPTEKQIDYLLALAESVNVSVDVSSVKDRRTASEVIDALKVLRQHGLGKSEAANGGLARQKSFELATTLVFNRYLRRGMNPSRAEGFWDDLRVLHAGYVAHARMH